MFSFLERRDAFDERTLLPVSSSYCKVSTAAYFEDK
jgi:hypothetical protein